MGKQRWWRRRGPIDTPELCFRGRCGRSRQLVATGLVLLDVLLLLPPRLILHLGSRNIRVVYTTACRLWAAAEGVTNLSEVAVYYTWQSLVHQVGAGCMGARWRRGVRAYVVDFVIGIQVRSLTVQEVSRVSYERHGEAWAGGEEGRAGDGARPVVVDIRDAQV